MMSKKIVLFCLILVSFKSYAQNRVGNGGDVIVCSSENEKQLEQVQLLDFYESSSTLQTSSESYDKILNTLISKLTTIDHSIGEQYKKRWALIQNEIEFKADIELVDIKDSLHLLLPLKKNCSLKQIAIRRALTAANQKTFIFNQIYWNKLSSIHQAGLIMHEMIYENFSKLGETDSVKARALNAYLFSADFEKKGAAGFWEMIKSLKVPIYKR